MVYRNINFYLFILLFNLILNSSFGQAGVPAGIHYQAVARDNFGKELMSTSIDVRFSIVTQNPLGPVVYQELHAGIITSKYGVFSLIIGKGTPTGGIYSDLSRVQWSESSHYLKVEVKFENIFIEMGTMQFMAVPYALFASRSLEPGPQGTKGDTGAQGIPGPKGEPGNPATDDQTLSVINIEGSDYLAISGGNQVKISNIERDGDPMNEIQDLLINSDKLKITNNARAVEWDLSPYRQSLTYDPVTRVIGITGTTSSINLTELKNDDDASTTNEIQTLSFNSSSNTLSLTNSASVDLTPLKDDADASVTNEIQSLSLVSDVLSISGSNSVNLSPYKDNTDSQQLTYSPSTNTISLTNGGSINLGSMVAFRATKLSSETVPTWMSDYDFVATTEIYDEGSNYDNVSGIFNAPTVGIYSFVINYFATGTADSRAVKIFLNGSLYEILNSAIAPGSSITRQTTMKLAANDKIKIIINVGTGLETGTGSFSGFRVY